MLRIISPALQPSQGQFNRCPHCGGRLNQVQSFLNTREDKPVRIFKCDGCQKLTWDD
jgi:uncharacterized protein with PIN domain